MYQYSVYIVTKISQATFTDSNGCCSLHTPHRDVPLVSNSDFFHFYVCISVVDFRLNKGYQPVTDYLNIFTSTIGVVIARWAVVVCFVANSVGRFLANPVPLLCACFFVTDCPSLLMILFCCCHWLSQCLSLCHWLTVTSPLSLSLSLPSLLPPPPPPPAQTNH